jgi:alpha/beta superfamily hydrolase
MQWLPNGVTDKGTTLIIPPFAEELNKSRWILAEVGRELARRGVASILPDLYGTGDSDGEFREACWTRWRKDIAQAAAWSAAQGRPVGSQ